MNGLVFRDLPVPEATTLQAEFPAGTFRVAIDAATLNAGLARPDAIFGHVPVDVVQRAPRLAWLQIVFSGFDDLGRLGLECFKQNVRRRLRGEPLEHVGNFARGY